LRKLLKDKWFCLNLEKKNDGSTKVANESYYQPANLMARIMNGLIIRRTIRKAQEKILQNLKLLAEK